VSDEQQPNGSAAPRPTGKRQLSGAASTTSTDSAKKNVVRVEDKNRTDSPGGGIAAFPGEVVSEMKKVVWPTRGEMLQYTLITFAFLIVMTALVWGVDTLAGLGVEKILTN